MIKLTYEIESDNFKLSYKVGMEEHNIEGKLGINDLLTLSQILMLIRNSSRSEMDTLDEKILIKKVVLKTIDELEKLAPNK